jgi:hypothetical protein
MGGRLARLGMVMLAIVALAAPVDAGPLPRSSARDCPRPVYTPTHYWTPGLYRFSALIHGPAIPVWPPDREPGIPPTFQVIGYPCPAGEPPSLQLDQLYQSMGGQATPRP